MHKKKILNYVGFLIIIVVVGVMLFQTLGVDDIPANPAFDDYLFYKCVVDAYNKTNDHVDYSHNLTDEELQKITELNCNYVYGNIESLNGLEKLTNLESLSLYYYHFNEIDLKNQTKLKKLYLGTNDLTTIDLSHNTELTDLDLKFNKLNALDLSANPLLTNVNLTGNKLTEINLDQNINLSQLDISENELTTIDLSKNKLLTELNLSENNLTTINLDQNSNLTKLDISENELTTAELSKNKLLNEADLSKNKLTEINLEQNSNLTQLNISENELTTIDPSLFPNLTNLNLSGNNLTSIDIRQNRNLSTLNLSNNSISTIDLSQNSNLIDLNLSVNNFSTINLLNNNALKNLNLGSNRFTSIEVDNLLQLETLNLENNKIDSIDLSSNSNLTNLNLNNNNISSIDLTANNNLSTLELGNNHLNTINIDNMSQLKTLNLNNNQLKNINIDNNRGIIYLDLGNNQLDSIDIQNLKYLETLNLSNNNLTSLNIINNNNLHSIDISNNWMILESGNIKLFVNINRWNGYYSQALVECSTQSYDDPCVIGKVTKYMQDHLDGFDPIVALNIEQKKTIKPIKENNEYTINLNDYFTNLSSSKLNVTQNNINNSNGKLTFSEKPNTIKFKYDSISAVLLPGSFDGTSWHQLSSQYSRGLGISIPIAYTILIPPEINSFYIGGETNPATINDTNTTLYLTYDQSSVTHYCINTENNSDTCKWQEINGNPSNISYEITDGDGSKTLYAFVKNSDNVISDGVSDTVNLKTTKPVVSKVTIGGQETQQYITTLMPKVYLYYTGENVTDYCLNDENDVETCDWKKALMSPISTTYSFTPGDGEKIIYAFVKDNIGNVSVVKSAKTILDTEAPTIEEFYLGGKDNPDNVNTVNTKAYLSWQNDDVKDYCISSSNNSDTCEWKSVSGNNIEIDYTLSNIIGKQIRYAYLRDKAGNISQSKEDNISIQAEIPVIEEFYLGGKDNPEYTNSTIINVYLKWTSDNVTHYCVNNVNDSSSCHWEEATGKSINVEYILNGVEDEQTRYAFIKNSSGIVSEAKADTIKLQIEKPRIKEFYLGGKNNPKHSKNFDVDVYLSWDEANINAYCLTEETNSDNCSWTSASDNSILTKYKFTEKDGLKTLYAFIKNNEDVVSEIASDTINIDTTKPIIKEFYIGGENNPDVIDNYKTNVYISWLDNDVIKYCVNDSGKVEDCTWQDAGSKKINIDYTLKTGEGEKTLYAFIQDEAGYISNVKEDKVTVKIPTPVEEIKPDDSENNNENNKPSQNETDKPLDKGPQTGGYAIGLIFVLGISLGVAYKYYLSKNNRIKKI